MRKQREDFWEVPLLGWDKVAIIGGGHSLKGADWNNIRSLASTYHFIGTNAAYKLGNWIEMIVFGDKKFWDWNKEELVSFSNPVIAVNEDLMREGIKTTHRLGIGWETNRKRRRIAWNSNSGAAAINLAALLGAEKIILLGFDMKLSSDGENNWHEYHKTPTLRPEFGKFINRFRYVDEGCKESRIKVINANPDSALPYFPKMSIEDAFNAKCQ